MSSSWVEIDGGDECSWLDLWRFVDLIEFFELLLHYGCTVMVVLVLVQEEAVG